MDAGVTMAVDSIGTRVAAACGNRSLLAGMSGLHRLSITVRVTHFVGAIMKYRMFIASMLLAASLNVTAAVTVESPWVRATVPGQSATGAYMVLRSSEDAVLTGVMTPVAGVADVHQMTLEGGVMKMRTIQRLALPAGKSVELKSGGYHIMIMDMKRPLSVGDIVPLTLSIEGGGRTQKVEVKAEVRALGDVAEGHHHHH